MTSGLLVSASAPATKITAVNDSDIYIVVFKDNQSLTSTMNNQVAAFETENNATVLYTYSTINGMAIKVPSDAISKLNTLPNVKYIEKNVVFHATLDKAAPVIGAPQVWTLGYTGEGIKVAEIDTGIDGTHPDLTGRIVEWKDFVNGKTAPYDDYGHGTHVAGIIGGNGNASSGKYKGIAPNVEYIGIKVLDSGGSGTLDNILAGMDYATKSDARIISMSLGSETHTQSLDDAVTKAVQAGKVVVVAAGNSGPNANTIACPADSPDAITVGATDDNDQIASFSSRGPNYDGSVKPDVTAPGVDIVSDRATGTNDDKAIDTYYLSMSGTSMATPMVSGAIADLLQKQPNLTVAQVKSIMEKTAKPLGSGLPNNDYGYGRISIVNAINYLDGNYTPSPVTSPTPTPSPSIGPTPTSSPSITPTPNPNYPNPSYPGYPYPGNNTPSYPYPGHTHPVYPGHKHPRYTHNPGRTHR